MNELKIERLEPHHSANQLLSVVNTLVNAAQVLQFQNQCRTEDILGLLERVETLEKDSHPPYDFSELVRRVEALEAQGFEHISPIPGEESLDIPWLRARVRGLEKERDELRARVENLESVPSNILVGGDTDDDDASDEQPEKVDKRGREVSTLELIERIRKVEGERHDAQGERDSWKAKYMVACAEFTQASRNVGKWKQRAEKAEERMRSVWDSAPGTLKAQLAAVYEALPDEETFMSDGPDAAIRRLRERAEKAEADLAAVQEGINEKNRTLVERWDKIVELRALCREAADYFEITQADYNERYGGEALDALPTRLREAGGEA